MAMSDAEGQVTIGIMSEHGGTNSIHFASDTSNPSIGTVTAPALCLTAFCRKNGIEHLHLVKSDTEGHDFAVIRGARDLFTEHRIDVMQFEYGHHWVFARSYLKDVLALIEGLPYRSRRSSRAFSTSTRSGTPSLIASFSPTTRWSPSRPSTGSICIKGNSTRRIPTREDCYWRSELRQRTGIRHSRSKYLESDCVDIMLDVEVGLADGNPTSRIAIPLNVQML